MIFSNLYAKNSSFNTKIVTTQGATVCFWDQEGTTIQSRTASFKWVKRADRFSSVMRDYVYSWFLPWEGRVEITFNELNLENIQYYKYHSCCCEKLYCDRSLKSQSIKS